MASTPVSSGQLATSSGTTLSSSGSFIKSQGLDAQTSGQAPNSLDDDNDSGDEWGMEIPVGNLIIDLDADLQKDIQKKNDARNTNNNNCITGSNSNSSQNQVAANEPHQEKAENSSISTKNSKSSSATNASTPSPAANKTKSKTKKSSKSVSGNKHSSASAGAVLGKADQQSAIDNSVSSRSVSKSESAQSTKSGRNYKKHSNKNSEKRGDSNVTSTKDGREKQSKTVKSNNKHMSQANSTIMSSTTSPSYVSSPVQSGLTSTSFGTYSLKSLRGSSGNSALGISIDDHTPANDDLNRNVGTSRHVCDDEESARSKNNISAESPVMSATAHLCKHRRTSSMPSPMKNTQPSSSVGTKMPDATSSPLKMGRGAESQTVQATSSKRDRNTSNGSTLSAPTKKTRMEKEPRAFVSGMTPSDGESLVKANTLSPVNTAISLPGQTSTKIDCKMTVGQQKGSSESKTDRRSSTRNSSSANSKNASKNSANTSGSSSSSTGQDSSSLPRNSMPAPENQKRSVGTLTTHADVGVCTEPESLGPCEPGTNVNLSGIVWHETESGVLVVNVTWRNRSYVGTLLDATKHDWAPPRIPDVDSDAEFRVKSGRPKRQRAANGNGLSDGRKSRKAANATGNDEYKCSPSTSNKRRSNKISESDACSVNDGDICATPIKSAKRARMSRAAASKQSAQKAVNTPTVVKESSGDGTSGSGSSTCSSPVMECSYANCKKRYNGETALKYHESYAHKDEDNEKTSEKNRTDADSPMAVDSPKDFENASTKSTDETLISDSNSSPNEPEASAEGPTTNPKPMDTESLTRPSPSTQAPFVVTQPNTALAKTTQSDEKFPPTSFPNSNNNNPSNLSQSGFMKKTATGEGPRTSMLSTGEFERERPRQSPPIADNVSDHPDSPYTLTDSQSNESISLKTHTPNKTSTRSYHSTRPTTSYGDSQGRSSNHSSMMESSSAVDNESAQAVQTLLQLQENTHDQLPGLTPYSQPSRSTPLQLPKEMPTTSLSTSSTASFPQLPGDKGAQSHTSDSGAKTMHHGIVQQQFRGHSKDGTPLPRMSVRVSSPRNQYSNGQYVNVNYPHGAVTANSPQERTTHNMPTSGLKTVKGKTVPIPTDPQQVLGSSSQAPWANNTTVVSSVNSGKKQKRKKQRSELSSKSPTEQSNKVLSSNPNSKAFDNSGPTFSEQVRIKQEQPLQPVSTSAPPTQASSRGQTEVDNHPSSRAVTPHTNVSGPVKTENLSSETSAPSASRPSVHPQPTSTSMSRTVLQPQAEMAHREQVQSQQVAPNAGKSSGTKTPHGRMPEQGQFIPHGQLASNTNAVEDRADLQSSRDGRGRNPPSQSTMRHGSSHSLPGSRSITPVSSAGQVSSKQGQPQQGRESNAPAMGRPSGKEASVKSEAAGGRPSAEGQADLKRLPGAQHHGYGQFPMLSYVGDPYQAEFMHHPKLARFFEHVITQEYQKEQKPKEEPKENLKPHLVTGGSRHPRSTPSPHDSSRISRPKSPTRDGRKSLDSPPRAQQRFSSPHPQVQASGQRIIHPVHRGNTPRVSPVPQESAPVKIGGGFSGAPRGRSPIQHATPPPISGKRPPRPNSETERFHRRDGSIGERPPTTSRTPTITPNRKPPPKEVYPEQSSQSPDKKAPGPQPASLYPSPNVPLQIAGGRPPIPYYAAGYPPHLLDPRSIAAAPYFSTAYMLPGPHAQSFPSYWPHGVPPTGVPGPGAPEKSQTPHPVKPSRDRSSSGSRSPFREESERLSRDGGARGRDVNSSYPPSKERRTSDGPSQVRKSVTPDPKVQAIRNSQGENEVNPPMQRHLHTHHHIHEGFPPMLPAHPPYQYQMAAASAVLAGSEAAALAPYPKRELP